MARTTQSQEMINAGIMVQGINAHAETLAARKIDAAPPKPAKSSNSTCPKPSDASSASTTNANG